MKIQHVIPTVGGSAPEALQETQRLTLHSIERALRCVDTDIEVDVRAVHFPDEPIGVDWVTDLPILHRSVLDLGQFDVPRRLPLLSDVLSGFGGPDQFDIAVFSNIDIALQPHFYDLAVELVTDGSDAVSLTRRTVHAHHRGSSWASLAAQLGRHHPGDDCFVFESKLLSGLRPVHAALGVRWVARCLLWQLHLAARSYRHAGDLHATFHLGDDRAWVDPRLNDYDRFNEDAAARLVRDLVAEHGAERVRRLQGTAPFVDAIESGGPVESPPPRRRSAARIDDRPLTAGAVRMVFSANPGRSGSQYLAELLGSTHRVSAGHERAPSMTGGWLREVYYGSPPGRTDHRRIKADAIRAQTRRLPSGWTYADSSHMFVKTFADVVFDEFQHELISVVVLRRNLLAVAKSFFELDILGPDRHQWHHWMASPTAPRSLFHIDHGDVASQFDLIFGYLIDVELRTRRLRDRTPSVAWVDVDLDDITTVDGARSLFHLLELEPPDHLDQITARRVNTKTNTKTTTHKSVTIEHAAARWASFVDRFGDRKEFAEFVASRGPVV